jgi:hypothetical protein
VFIRGWISLSAGRTPARNLQAPRPPRARRSRHQGHLNDLHHLVRSPLLSFLCTQRVRPQILPPRPNLQSSPVGVAGPFRRRRLAFDLTVIP